MHIQTFCTSIKHIVFRIINIKITIIESYIFITSYDKGNIRNLTNIH